MTLGNYYYSQRRRKCSARRRLRRRHAGLDWRHCSPSQLSDHRNFRLFGIALFMVVERFGPTVQFELVASGQVIQFATVMVILIVVCVLGMSQSIRENTLGTLLGAIGGYVLSQGVGSKAARDATRDKNTPSPTAPTDTSARVAQNHADSGQGAPGVAKTTSSSEPAPPQAGVT
jgi:hypothetical protein